MNILIRLVELLFVASIATMAWLVWQHRGHWFVRFTDLHQHEKEHLRKQEIMSQRIERTFSRWYQTTSHYLVPLWNGVRTMVLERYHRLVELEKHYRQTVQMRMLSGTKKVEFITKSLEEADALLEQEEYEKAEQKFIAILNLEKSHTRAYEGLGEVYWNLGHWKEAMETYRFLFRRLKEKTPVGYFHRWGESALELGNAPQAVEAFERALAAEPNQPRTLDLLAESAILGANVDVATAAVETLKAVNPENQKIPEFEEKIKELRASMVSTPNA